MRVANEMGDEPIFMAVPRNDPEWQNTVLDAQRSLHVFRQLLRSECADDLYPNIKAVLDTGEDRAFIWLVVLEDLSTGFVTRAFELPPEFEVFQDQETIVEDCDVKDWMVIQDGVLRGGYSVRYQRLKTPPSERAQFDARVGVTTYAKPDVPHDH